MVTNRILLFGGNGQVGKALQHQSVPADWQWQILTRSECDFVQPGAIAKAIQDFAPDLVINAAALTNIESCEQNPDLATAINFHAVANIAAQCASCDAPFIHLSTDYVFDGQDGTTPYLPDSPMNPLNVYGQTKMMGEEAARHGLYWHVIVRTSLVFSSYGNNVLTKTLRQIDTQDEVSALSDQFANPTSADAVAQSIITMADAIMNGKGNGFGTFHISGEPTVSRYEFLQEVMKAYAPFTSRRPLLIPQLSSNISKRVPRPAHSALNNDKAKETYGIILRSWKDDLQIAVQKYVEGRSPQ